MLFFLSSEWTIDFVLFDTERDDDDDDDDDVGVTMLSSIDVLLIDTHDLGTACCFVLCVRVDILEITKQSQSCIIVFVVVVKSTITIKNDKNDILGLNLIFMIGTKKE